ncbi:MAG TPA: HdeD family acid-resistance protein [Woeseiaceae bacterium]|nr:HdeD family acid-resistance protein [Woeseiaceae bacterium]
MKTDNLPSPEVLIITDEVRRHRAWFLVVGLATVLLGAAALIFPVVATLAVSVLVGWILTIYGTLAVIHAYRNKRWNGFLWSLFGALLALGAGVVLLFFPTSGALSLTLLIAAFLLTSGAFRVLLALRLRPADRWGWLLLSGLLAIVLAIVITLLWPDAVAWIVGMLVGVDLVFSGWASILLGLAARRPA